MTEGYKRAFDKQGEQFILNDCLIHLAEYVLKSKFKILNFKNLRKIVIGTKVASLCAVFLIDDSEYETLNLLIQKPVLWERSINDIL